MNKDAILDIVTAPKRDSRHWKPGTVTWGELLRWVDKPGKVKESGNYLLGSLRETSVAHVRSKPTEKCTGLHRRKDAVVSRSALTLDIDSPNKGFDELVDLTFPYAALVHTTYSSAPDAPRYRMIIPTDRVMLPDEYVAAAQAVMVMLGEDQFDPGTTQPERYMFRPAAQEAGWFNSFVLDGDPLPVDEFLRDFETDLAAKPLPKPSRNKRDPFELEGWPGAFNRAYADDWDLLIEEYELPYDKVAEDRYQLQGAASVAGMGPIADTHGLVFSHHTTDPAYNTACSAFDLVRLHEFGHEDENAKPGTPFAKLPSYLSMLELAAKDKRARAEMVNVDLPDDLDDDVDVDDLSDTEVPDAWRFGLDITSKGVLKDTIDNWDLIADNDPVLRTIFFNELTFSIEVAEDLPWAKLQPGQRSRVFNQADRYNLQNYLERVYKLRPTLLRVDSLITVCGDRRKVNPVRDYLEGLVWDGKPRLDTCLPGVHPNEFTRLVARRSLAAAVARMFEPGIKWDHTLVLYGDEGLGKSFWIEKMSRGYFGNLGPIDHKDTLIALQRSWIIINDEGHSLRKSDNDAQKEFLTRTADLLRLPYEREMNLHPRRCVIWSTTNDDTFLSQQRGNRRFLIVHCEDRVDFEAMTPEYIDQVWAEAVHVYKNGEPLYLSVSEAEYAELERAPFVEEDVLGGLIEEYLSTPVPEDWDEMSPESRVAWLSAYKNGFQQPGKGKITRVCTAQLWVEALGRHKGDHRRGDLLDIGAAMKRIPGWKLLPGRHRHPGYGPQVLYGYVGGDDSGPDLDDLL